MASLVSSSVEEIGFRGYFQGPLESWPGGTAAIAAMIVVIAPAHAITQGLVWPVAVFYLPADAMFGWLARLTGSILPGFVVHSLGLFIFFTLIWPGDRSRVLVSAGGANIWFWIHVGQIFLAIPAILVFMRLARLTAENRQTGPGNRRPPGPGEANAGASPALVPLAGAHRLVPRRSTDSEFRRPGCRARAERSRGRQIPSGRSPTR
jgi:hypothetical protein